MMPAGRTLLFVVLALGASAATWHSPATGLDLRCEFLESSTVRDDRQGTPVVFYLTNLATPRTGTEPDQPILRDLRAAGHLVVVLDYAHHPAARWPFINRDLVALREQLHRHELLAERGPDLAHVYIVPAGHRLIRDVVYFRAPGRTLAMDIIYPAQPAQRVGALLEFSCDNENRMGNFSLQACTDTILEGAATDGYAVAMADHPVAPPYRGLDPMPDCAQRSQAAARTLRAAGETLGLNGRIVPVGFSRGSGIALMAVTTARSGEIKPAGENPDVSSAVQGAVVMSGRFTYLDLLPDDAMLARYERAWGPRATREGMWRAHGALDYLAEPADVPLFLTINSGESADARHQMRVLRRRLTELNSPFVYCPEEDARGHKVPLAAPVLAELRQYLQGQLQFTPTPRSPNPPSS